jgi:hypothetical protein
MLVELKNRITFKLSIWIIIAYRILPLRCRSKKAKQLYSLLQKNQKRLDYALDIRNIV